MQEEINDAVTLSKYEAIGKLAQEAVQLLQQKNFEQTTITGYVIKLPLEERNKYFDRILDNVTALKAVVTDLFNGLHGA